MIGTNLVRRLRSHVAIVLWRNEGAIWWGGGYVYSLDRLLSRWLPSISSWHCCYVLDWLSLVNMLRSLLNMLSCMDMLLSLNDLHLLHGRVLNNNLMRLGDCLMELLLRNRSMFDDFLRSLLNNNLCCTFRQVSLTVVHFFLGTFTMFLPNSFLNFHYHLTFLWRKGIPSEYFHFSPFIFSLELIKAFIHLLKNFRTLRELGILLSCFTFIWDCCISMELLISFHFFNVFHWLSCLLHLNWNMWFYNFGVLAEFHALNWGDFFGRVCC